MISLPKVSISHGKAASFASNRKMNIDEPNSFSFWFRLFLRRDSPICQSVRESRWNIWNYVASETDFKFYKLYSNVFAVGLNKYFAKSVIHFTRLFVHAFSFFLYIYNPFVMFHFWPRFFFLLSERTPWSGSVHKVPIRALRVCVGQTHPLPVAFLLSLHGTNRFYVKSLQYTAWRTGSQPIEHFERLSMVFRVI